MDTLVSNVAAHLYHSTDWDTPRSATVRIGTKVRTNIEKAPRAGTIVGFEADDVFIVWDDYGDDTKKPCSTVEKWLIEERD